MNKQTLSYNRFERLPMATPVDRIDFIADGCAGRDVLDLGCLDETALVKFGTRHWLHHRICEQAKHVIGVDSSPSLPPEGKKTAVNGVILRGDALQLSKSDLGDFCPDIIVAGEFIEHIPNPSEFLGATAASYPSQTLVLSTPNASSLSNFLLGLMRMEVQHPDHLHLFTFKTLNTLLMRSPYMSWEIIPYHFYATELLLQTSGAKRMFVALAEKCVRLLERLFPALSFGYIVVAHPTPTHDPMTPTTGMSEVAG